MNESATYRNSHTAKGYGETYETAYDEATYYGQLWRTIEKDLLISALEEIRTSGAKSCLDFACGTGRILSVVEELFDKSVGVDVSNAMIEVASRKCPKSEIIIQDLTKSNLDSTFDVVTAFRFFRNAENSLRIGALQGIRKQLKTGGILVANIHGNPYSPGMIALSAKTFFRGGAARTISRSTFQRLLDENGFQTLRNINYSYLPRIGRFFPRWYRPWMEPTERVMAKLPILKYASESTLFIAKAID